MAQSSSSASGGTPVQSVATDIWQPPPIQNIPAQPISGAWVSRERLAMLAMARRNRLGEGAWASITGFVGALPSASHTLYDAYFGDKPTHVIPTNRLIDVIICVAFFVAAVVFIFFKGGEETSKQILKTILNPTDENVSWHYIFRLIGGKFGKRTRQTNEQVQASREPSP